MTTLMLANLYVVFAMKPLLLLAVTVSAVVILIMSGSLSNDHKSGLGRYLRRLLCQRGRHRQRDGTVRRIGNGYTARCRGCGALLHRETQAGRWLTLD